MGPVVDAWVIIADGTKDVAEANLKLAELEQRALPVELAPGYPQVADSAALPGLNPGFSIVVVGACAEKAQADAALELVRAVAPGAYLRHATTNESCPEVAKTKAATTAGPPIASFPLGAATQAHLDVKRPAGAPDCPDQSLVFEARLEGGRLMSTLALTGACSAEESSSWADPLPVTIDGQTFLAIHGTESVGGATTGTDALYGLLCGAWRPVLGPVASGSERAVAQFDNPVPGQIRMRRWLRDPSAAELKGPPDETLTFTLDPRTCTTLPVGELTIE